LDFWFRYSSLWLGTVHWPFLEVSVHAFSISGGLLLFVTALPMLFGQRPALQSAETSERGPEDIAIIPLAIPLLTGPDTITSVLLLMAQARGSLAKLAAVAGGLALVFLLTRLVIGFGAEGLMRLLRPGGLHVVTRVLGICLQRWPCNSCSMELASSYGCSR
jgi:multiple antibiotic resistance protein